MTIALLRHRLYLLAGKLQFVGQHSFWTVWLVITGVLLVCAAWLFRPSAVAASQWTKTRAGGFGPSRAGTVALLLLSVFFAGYSAMILAGEDFAGYDNAQFTAYSARGIDFPPSIWREGGRFYPLAMQQFNVVGRFTRSIAGYHAFQIAQLLALTAILVSLDEEVSIAWRCALAVTIMGVPSVAISFSGLIYQECDLMLWLACMVFSIQLFARTRSTWFAVSAALSAQIALYYKEPMFILLLAFAASRVLLRARFSGGLLKVVRDAESRLDLFIAAEALVYAGYYAIVMFGATTLQYMNDRRSPLITAVRIYGRIDWLIWIFVAFTLVRLYRVWRGSVSPALLWDGLACGGVAYFGAYLVIRIVTPYFLAPADLIAVLYLGRFLYLAWGGMKTPMRAAAVMTAVLVLSQNLDHAAFNVLERKWFIQQKRRVADAIIERHRRDPEHPVKLYFPFSSEYYLAEYSSYLTYRGLTVEEMPPVSGKKALVEIYTDRLARTGRCVFWEPFVCHAGPVGPEGVTVVLPEDPVSPTQLKPYEEAKQKLLPQGPGSLRPGRLYRALEFFRPGSGLL